MSQADTSPSPQPADDLRDTPWQSHVAQPLLIALQATCLIVGPWVVVELIAVNPQLRVIPPLAFLASLAGVYSAGWLRLPQQRLTSKTTFRLAELMVVLVTVRLLTWGLGGNWPDLASLRGWILEPSTFFDGFFLATAVLVALAWDRASIVGGIFYELALSPAELVWSEEQRSGGFWRRARPAEAGRVSRQELVQDYVNQWVLGAMFLAFCAGATRVQVGPDLGLSLLRTGVPSQIVVAMVFYLLIGLILTSQARLAVLRAQWLIDGVEMPEGLPGRWRRFSLLLIIAIGLLATLLPLGSTWQVGTILNIVLSTLVQIVLAFVYTLVALFAAILSLFGATVEPLPELLEPAPVQPAPALSPMPTLPPWLGGASFWLVVVVIVVLALSFFFGREGIALNWRKLRLALGRLAAGLHDRWRGLRRLAGAVRISLPGRKAAAGEKAAAGGQAWRFIRLGALPPREQVRYFYLSTLRRAGQQGVVRQPHQTPREFVRDLETTWPEAELDVEALTEAFVTARYDTAEISPSEARQTKSLWERIKRLLRGGKPERSGE